MGLVELGLGFDNFDCVKNKGRLPSMVVFHQSLSSVKGLSDVVLLCHTTTKKLTGTGRQANLCIGWLRLQKGTSIFRKSLFSIVNLSKRTKNIFERPMAILNVSNH